MFEEYSSYFKNKEEQWESLCIRCGGCCGAFDDPCKHLKKDQQGKYCCEIYTQRFGLRESASGERFNCVPIKEIIRKYWKNDHLCVYKSHLKTSWMKL
jgi:hypothetical protein